jgi:sugar phosphate isomerase/epimerase
MHAGGKPAINTCSTMHLAIRTASLNPDTPRALTRAAELGFRYVEINLQPKEFGYDYHRKTNTQFYSRLKKQVDELGLSVWSVTPPRLNQEQMFSARARKEILLAAVGIAAKLNSRVYVVQPADIFENELSVQTYIQERGAPPVVEGYDETWAQVVNRRMTMALANHDYWLGTVLTNQAERLKKIIADLAIDCALDLERALLRNSLESWLESVGNRVAVAYLCDIEETALHEATMKGPV